MLLFIDTNIFLDFYRFEKSVSLDYVQKLKDVSDKIIMTHIVEMEFLKNRQKVIQGTLNDINSSIKINFPEILSKDRTVKSIPKQISSIQQKVTKTKQKIDKILLDYNKNDSLYKSFNKLFRKDDEITLNDHKEMFDDIYSRAEKRFKLGYPPRKSKDLTFGDSINWEWILEICRKEKSDVVIVSRDSDYGNNLLLNDYLKEEFIRKVGHKKNVFLRPSLTKTLKDDFNVDITQEEIVYENNHIYRLYRQVGLFDSYINTINKKNITKKLKGLKEEEASSYLDSIVSDHIQEVLEIDPVLEIITGTNATAWMVDHYDLDKIDIEESKVRLEISFIVSAYDHHEDKPFSGDKITGSLDAVIYDEGYIHIYNIEAAIDFD